MRCSSRKRRLDEQRTKKAKVQKAGAVGILGARVVFRFADSWQVGMVKSSSTKGQSSKNKVKGNNWFTVALRTETLVLNLAASTRNKDWVFLKDVASAEWREGLKQDDQIEILNARTGQWLAGRITTSDAISLTVQQIGGKFRITTSRRDGANFAPMHTFVAVETEDDGHSSLCEVCGVGGEVVMCDGNACPHVYHIACAPSLELVGGELPEGDWFCPSCCDCSHGSKKQKK
jgi:hypothetical protein